MEQHGLADAGLAGHEDDTTGARDGVPGAILQHVEGVLPLQQPHRAIVGEPDSSGHRCRLLAELPGLDARSSLGRVCDPGRNGAPIVVPAEVGAFTGEPIPLHPVRRVNLTTLVDNAVDLLATDLGPAHRRGLGTWPRGQRPGHQLDPVVEGPVAEHGFSALVDVELADGAVHRLLYDTGVSPDGMVTNMRRLGLAPDSVEAVVCSHGHFDHTTGLDGLSRAVGGGVKLPVVVHPEFWTRRRIALPGRDPWDLPSTSRTALEGVGFAIVERPEPSFLLAESVLITGEVARTTDFERGMPAHEALRDDGWRPDPLVLDDQALVVHVSGRGLVVLTGCGHAGIVNIVRYARALTGVEPVYAVVGGFHLTLPGAEQLIDATVTALADLAPQVVVPAHCTGWRATHELATRLPAAFVPNYVGTRLELAAA
jgi:7,8-dihydropterin-6-yl-methyl-4-(beta-D-ribofuranosyl)aminobenzene 5'-phosphate synthase